MEKLVQSFLFKNYEINDFSNSVIGDVTFQGHAIYPIDDKNFIYPQRLLTDLNTIFAIDEEDLKVIVKSWGHSIVKDLDLTDWWSKIDYSLVGIAMPMVGRVMAQTIGLDLVSVQPMSAPIGQLMYMDYQYGDFISGTTTPQINGRVYDEEVIQVAAHSTFGELDHPNNGHIEVTVNDRDEESAMVRAINKWSSIIGVSSRRSEI